MQNKLYINETASHTDLDNIYIKGGVFHGVFSIRSKLFKKLKVAITTN